MLQLLFFRNLTLLFFFFFLFFFHHVVHLFTHLPVVLHAAHTQQAPSDGLNLDLFLSPCYILNLVHKSVETLFINYLVYFIIVELIV
jgi:hypothetical protein